MSISAEQDALSKQNYARMNQLEQPSIDFNQSLVGGDKAAAMSALAPALAPIQQANKANKEAIWEGMPAGAGRDVALSQQDQSARTNIAGV